MAIIHQSGAFGGYQNTGFGGRRRLPGAPPGTPAAAGPSPWAPPTTPPPGTYDPQLDWKAEDQSLGYGQFQSGQAVSGDRAHSDFWTAYNKANATHIANLGALGKALDRANQDYGTSTGALNTSFANLGSAQTQKARAMGEANGGAVVQSAQRRAANQSTDQGKLDQAIARFRQDNAAATNTENQSWHDLVGNLSSDTPDSYIQTTPGDYGSLGTRFGRTLQDLATSGKNAFDSNALFQSMVDQGKTYSAQQNGLLPTLPSGSYATLPTGQNQWEFGGVNYVNTPGSQFLTPTSRPSAQSVMETGSLLGTDFAKTPPPSYYHPKRKR